MYKFSGHNTISYIYKLGDDPLNLEDRLGRLMNMWEISENELARRTKLNQPTINRILKGSSRDPRTSTLRPLANFFGISIAQIQGDERMEWEELEQNRRYGRKGIPPLRRVPIVGEIGNIEGKTMMIAKDRLGEVTFPTADSAATAHTVTTDKFWPRYRKGERLILENGSELRQEDGALIDKTDGSVEIGYILFLRQQDIVMEGMTDRSERIEVSRNNIKNMYLIAGSLPAQR